MTEDEARAWATKIKATGQRIWLDRNPLTPSETIIVVPSDDHLKAATWLLEPLDCEEWLASH
jgi:hypothetical protein